MGAWFVLPSLLGRKGPETRAYDLGISSLLGFYVISSDADIPELGPTPRMDTTDSRNLGKQELFDEP